MGHERKKAKIRNQTIARRFVYLFLSVCICGHTEAFSTLRKTPVDSTTYLAPVLPQGISAGFILESESDQDKMITKSLVEVWGFSHMS